MNDYRVSIKVRNNRLLKAIEYRGEVCGARFAEKVGIRYGALLDLVNCKASPLDKDGILTPVAEKLIAWLKVGLDELFTADQLLPLTTNTAEIELDGVEIQALMDSRDPIAVLNQRDRQQSVEAALARLPGKQGQLLRLRFGLEGEGLPLEQAGEQIGLTREEARQMENKALRKLRHPVYSDALREFL